MSRSPYDPPEDTETRMLRTAWHRTETAAPTIRQRILKRDKLITIRSSQDRSPYDPPEDTETGWE